MSAKWRWYDYKRVTSISNRSQLYYHNIMSPSVNDIVEEVFRELLDRVVEVAKGSGDWSKVSY